MDLPRIARKITIILFAAQALTSSALIATATTNSIIGADLGGSAAWAGVPSAVYMLGSAGAALMWGFLMDSLGRRGGLALGLLMGVIGSYLAFHAMNNRVLIGFLFGMVFMGMAAAAMQLGRYAAAEVHPPLSRGRAISNVVLAGTIGAIFGPLLVSPAGQIARSLGMNELSGSYAAAVLLFVVGTLLIFLTLRPDPKEIGRQVATQYPVEELPGSEKSSIRLILRRPAVSVSIFVMVIAQVVMVSVMVITSLHMRGHQHSLGDLSLVISAHTIGMYAFSAISGRMVDRLGRAPVILIGASGLLLACLAAPLSPDTLPLAVSLFLLGLGWNFCYVGGPTLLSDQLAPAERSRTQGFSDLLVGLAAAAGSLSSGIIFARYGYTIMSLAGAVLSITAIVAIIVWQRRQGSEQPVVYPITQ
jgi:MFS family permease